MNVFKTDSRFEIIFLIQTEELDYQKMPEFMALQHYYISCILQVIYIYIIVEYI